MAKITVKLSYSILNTWSAHNFEAAVGMYLGKDIPATPAMMLGKLKHQIWEDYIVKNRCLPDEIGGGRLEYPLAEKKYEKLIPLGDKYQILLRGVPDCTDKMPLDNMPDGEIIYEFKVGLTSPTSYVDTFQADYYKLLKPKAHTAIYLCFNPYANTYSKGIKFLTDKCAERALEHVITFGSEMIEYLASQRFIINYKPEIYSDAG